jgi:hypothetical protein
MKEKKWLKPRFNHFFFYKLLFAPQKASLTFRVAKYFTFALGQIFHTP